MENEGESWVAADRDISRAAVALLILWAMSRCQQRSQIGRMNPEHSHKPARLSQCGLLGPFGEWWVEQ